MSAKNIVVSTLGVCFLFSGLTLAQATPMGHKDTKKKDQKHAVTQSIGAVFLKTEEPKKNDKKQDDKKSISATEGNHSFRLAVNTKKDDKKHKDDKPLLS
jgi:hypothetical protein